MRNILLMGALLMPTIALANPVPCSWGPVPGHDKAPQWALDVVKNRGGTLVVGLDDPMWQHAMCDEQNHTVTWSLPGEEDVNDGPVAIRPMVTGPKPKHICKMAPSDCAIAQKMREDFIKSHPGVKLDN